jgi:hypothetical protein
VGRVRHDHGVMGIFGVVLAIVLTAAARGLCVLKTPNAFRSIRVSLEPCASTLFVDDVGSSVAPLDAARLLQNPR